MEVHRLLLLRLRELLPWGLLMQMHLALNQMLNLLLLLLLLDLDLDLLDLLLLLHICLGSKVCLVL